MSSGGEWGRQGAGPQAAPHRPRCLGEGLGFCDSVSLLGCGQGSVGPGARPWDIPVGTEGTLPQGACCQGHLGILLSPWPGPCPEVLGGTERELHPGELLTLPSPMPSAVAAAPSLTTDFFIPVTCQAWSAWGWPGPGACSNSGLPIPCTLWLFSLLSTCPGHSCEPPPGSTFSIRADATSSVPFCPLLSSRLLFPGDRAATCGEGGSMSRSCSLPVGWHIGQAGKHTRTHEEFRVLGGALSE